MRASRRRPRPAGLVPRASRASPVPVGGGGHRVSRDNNGQCCEGVRERPVVASTGGTYHWSGPLRQGAAGEQGRTARRTGCCCCLPGRRPAGGSRPPRTPRRPSAWCRLPRHRRVGVPPDPSLAGRGGCGPLSHNLPGTGGRELHRDGARRPKWAGDEPATGGVPTDWPDC